LTPIDKRACPCDLFWARFGGLGDPGEANAANADGFFDLRLFFPWLFSATVQGGGEEPE